MLSNSNIDFGKQMSNTSLRYLPVPRYKKNVTLLKQNKLELQYDIDYIMLCVNNKQLC